MPSSGSHWQSQTCTYCVAYAAVLRHTQVIRLAFKAIQDPTPDCHFSFTFPPSLRTSNASHSVQLRECIAGSHISAGALPLFAMPLPCCPVRCTHTSRFSASTILFLCHFLPGYWDAWTPPYSYSTLSSLQLQFLLQSILSLFYFTGSMIKWKEPKNKIPYLGFKSHSIWHYPLNMAIC